MSSSVAIILGFTPEPLKFKLSVLQIIFCSSFLILVLEIFKL